MNSIPPDLYEHVRDLALNITNATLAEVHALFESLYQQLLNYYLEQSDAGRCHPFLLKTLADYTDDATQALSYYEKALAMSQQMNSDEPTQTVLIGIATRLLELGRREQAEAFLRDGRLEAVKRADSLAIEEADQLLKESFS